MTTKLRVIIVEDKEEDLRDISNFLADENICEPEGVSTAATYDDARVLIEEQAVETNLILLDLRIPRGQHDTNPDRGLGRRLLDHVHQLNRRSQVQINVIIVSAEEISEGWDRDMLMRLYAGTLVGVEGVQNRWRGELVAAV